MGAFRGASEGKSQEDCIRCKVTSTGQGKDKPCSVVVSGVETDIAAQALCYVTGHGEADACAVREIIYLHKIVEDD